MLRYMLDTNICIYVIKNRPEGLRERFNRLADQLCISAVTLAEIIYGAEKSARQIENIKVVEQFAARLDVLPFWRTCCNPLRPDTCRSRACRPPYWAS
jgi:tRNA(fMet)-specific endonuclease VapC